MGGYLQGKHDLCGGQPMTFATMTGHFRLREKAVKPLELYQE